jgi:hypothetical protein
LLISIFIPSDQIWASAGAASCFSNRSPRRRLLRLRLSSCRREATRSQLWCIGLWLLSRCRILAKTRGP